MSEKIQTHLNSKCDRAAQLIALIIEAAKGCSSVDVTLDVKFSSVAVTVTKASAVVLEAICGQTKVLNFLLSIDSGGVRAEML